MDVVDHEPKIRRLLHRPHDAVAVLAKHHHGPLDARALQPVQEVQHEHADVDAQDLLRIARVARGQDRRRVHERLPRRRAGVQLHAVRPALGGKARGRHARRSLMRTSRTPG